MTYFIISFVIIILLVVVMSLILKNAVKQVDEKSKSYFVDKLKEYDYLIDEKEKKLTLYIGNRVGDDRYVMLNDSKIVYLVSDAICGNILNEEE